VSLEDYDKNWLLSIDGVDCNIFLGEKEQEAPDEAHPPDAGRTATVTFICPWADRIALVAGLVGTVSYDGGTIVRTDPYSYPVAAIDVFDPEENPNGVFKNRTVCTGIRQIQGRKWRSDVSGQVTGVKGWGYFVYALVTAEFTTPPYLIEPIPGGNATGFNDLLGQTYCISKTRIAGEVFAPPSGSFIFNGGAFQGQPLNDVSSMQLRIRYELSCVRVRMPLVPTTTINSLSGSVNSNPMTLGNQSIDKGAALFTGANPEPKPDPYNGGIVNDVELLWLVNQFNPQTGAPTDWNLFLDPSGAWVPVVNKVDGDPVFAYEDHSRLFDNTIL
jgi:hypothetical protein